MVARTDPSEDRETNQHVGQLRYEFDSEVDDRACRTSQPAGYAAERGGADAEDKSAELGERQRLTAPRPGSADRSSEDE